MGRFLVLIGILISTSIFACSCNRGPFGENFALNSFVAEIEILKTYNINLKIGEENRFYKADIKILKLYKGDVINSIIVYGKVGTSDLGACEINLKKGERFLVYLDKSRKYIMSYCTARKSLLDSNINVERDALHFLVKKKISNTNCFYSIGKHFEKFKELKPKKSFAVYKLKIGAESQVETISAIQDFGTTKDSQIKNIIKDNYKIVRGYLKGIKNEDVTLVLFFDKKSRYVISPVI